MTKDTKAPNQNQQPEFHLDVDAQVVRQLGSELITDAEQALLELVKNSYDADAEWCNIIIDSNSEYEVPLPGSEKEEKILLKGRILVEDSGTGMGETALQNGWLTISLSTKREMKASGKTTPLLHRTPLGDKGLGRLGTMKLGNYLRITTHEDEDKKGYQVAFFWSECKSGRPLTQVPLSIKEVPKSGKKGTSIEIIGLSDPEYWKGEDRVNKLRFRLSTLVSPFKSFSNFTIGLTLNNTSLDLVSFSDKILNTATAHFECTWDESELELSGSIKLSLFKGTKEDDYEKYVVSDQGQTLYEYLIAQDFAARISLKKSKGKAWFLDFSEKLAWSDIPVIQEDRLPIAKPGDFVSELYAFNLNFSRRDFENMFNDLGDFGSTLRELSGVYIFRDNFRVRASNDWLKLGEQWTSGSSYYGLRPKNTIGYFALTAKSNPRLLEKSDREGFIENAEYRGFYTLATKFRSYANDSLENLRRGYVEFLRISKEKDIGFTEGMSPEDQAKQLEDLAKTAKQIETALKVSAKERTKALTEAKSQIAELLNDLPANSKSRREFANTLEAIEQLVQKIAEENLAVQSIVTKVAEKDKLAALISQRFEQFNTQITETYETVGIGLAAQGLVHELHPLLDQITARAKKVKSALDRAGVKNASVVADLDTIRTIANLVSRRMSFLDPMLRTFRETTEDIDLESFITEFFELRRERLESLGIHTYVSSSKSGAIHLRINRGRLIQILDNLIRNSEYWLKDYGLKNPGKKLAIHAEIENPRLTFYDTGPGVRPAMERVLFDIFVTDKPKGQGHGLGLFIVSQILKADGSSIRLGPKRNDAGRRFEFIIDFSGAIK